MGHELACSGKNVNTTGDHESFLLLMKEDQRLQMSLENNWMNV
jgi:hypothetical protein